MLQYTCIVVNLSKGLSRCRALCQHGRENQNFLRRQGECQPAPHEFVSPRKNGSRHRVGLRAVGRAESWIRAELHLAKRQRKTEVLNTILDSSPARAD